jgi:Flp pilus assembly protein TadG
MEERDQRGQFSVEVVLLAPLLLLLIFLTYEFGRVFGQWLIITNAAREGARFAITQTFDTSADAAIMQRVVQTAQGLESSQPLQAVACTNNQPPTGDTSCIGITRVTCPNSNYATLCSNTAESLVIVLVRYNVQTFFPINGTIPIIGSFNYPGSIQVTGQSYMRAF